MVIRNIIPNDLQIVTTMINDMYKELEYGVTFSESFIKARIKSKFFITKVVEIDNCIIGFSTIKITKNEYSDIDTNMGFLYELYITPSHRKQKFAKKLLQEMEQELINLEIYYYELYVSLNNKNGRNFWISNGLVPRYEVLSKKLNK